MTDGRKTSDTVRAAPKTIPAPTDNARVDIIAFRRMKKKEIIKEKQMRYKERV